MNLFIRIAIFIAVLAMSIAMPMTVVNAAPAQANPGDNATVHITLNADGTITMLADRKELYVQGDADSGLSDHKIDGVDKGNGTWAYTLPSIGSGSAEIKYAKSLIFDDGKCSISAGKTWFKCSGSASQGGATATGTGSGSAPAPGVAGGGWLDSKPGETVLQTGEGDLHGPAAGTGIFPALTGTYASRIAEIDAVVRSGCPGVTSGICYYHAQNSTDMIYAGSTDMVNHLKQEGDNVFNFLRTGGTMDFKTSSWTYMEAVNFTVADLQSTKANGYSIATRLLLPPGYFAFNNASNSINPGCRVANVNQIAWLNDPTKNTHFRPEVYLNFATGNTIAPDGSDLAVLTGNAGAGNGGSYDAGGGTTNPFSNVKMPSLVSYMHEQFSNQDFLNGVGYTWTVILIILLLLMATSLLFGLPWPWNGWQHRTNANTGNVRTGRNNARANRNPVALTWQSIQAGVRVHGQTITRKQAETLVAPQNYPTANDLKTASVRDIRNTAGLNDAKAQAVRDYARGL